MATRLKAVNSPLFEMMINIIIVVYNSISLFVNGQMPCSESPDLRRDLPRADEPALAARALEGRRTGGPPVGPLSGGPSRKRKDRAACPLGHPSEGFWFASARRALGNELREPRHDLPAREDSLSSPEGGEEPS